MGRARVLAVIAVLVSGSLAGGAAYALDQATKDKVAKPAVSLPTPVVTTEAPTESPTPDVVPTPSPTPSPTASPTPSPSPEATLTSSPTPRPTVTVTASPAPRRYPYPAPTTSYSGLIPHASLSQSTGTTATVFRVSGDASDGDGKAFFAGLTFQDPDGGDVASQPNPTSCKSFSKPTSPNTRYEPEPSTLTFGSYTHTFATPGEYTITVQVRSVNADCKPNGPKAESATLTFDVTVTQA